MHLRHLIVLIIDARNSDTRSCTGPLSSGWNEICHASRRGYFLIGQIKLTRIHVLSLSLSGVRIKQAAKHL